MTFDDVRQIAIAYPGVEERFVFGSPHLRVGKRFLASIAKIDKDTLILKVPDPLERELLLRSFPDVYYLTEHYASFECVLVRLPAADPSEIGRLFEQAWRHYAPKKLVAAFDARR